ncbi:SCO family protein [Aquimonas sp.]|jgi:protein SCO1/2|uniref:SCO family protein n=1 Tax=Aquimonas sp. TaxID=1872588 RepID=UPI0037BF0829
MNTPAPTGSGKLPTIAVLVAALAAGIGLFAGQRVFAPTELPQMQNSLLYPQFKQIPDFKLTADDGRDFTQADLRGRWSLVFVGFTHCPDICPTTLADLGKARAQMTDLPEIERPQIVFVSVDPERDSPKLAGDYAQYFDASARGVSADHAALLPFTRSLGMVYMQSELEGGGYTVDHSASVAIINPEGQQVGLVRPPLDPTKIAADLRALIAHRAASAG